VKRVVLVACALLATIVAANWLTTEFGFVPVGFGLTATAGTYAAGLALGLRDLLQDNGGKRWVLGVIAAGGVLSYLVSDPFIAIASAVAFAAGELIDFAVYTPLRAKAEAGSGRWTVAVAGSNLVGAIIDTALFIGIAFGVSLIWSAMPGQLVGKAWATLALLIPFWIGRAVSHRKRSTRSVATSPNGGIGSDPHATR